MGILQVAYIWTDGSSISIKIRWSSVPQKKFNGKKRHFKPTSKPEIKPPSSSAVLTTDNLRYFSGTYMTIVLNQNAHHQQEKIGNKTGVRNNCNTRTSDVEKKKEKHPTRLQLK